MDKIDTWVFDLDNTLYPAESKVFAQVHERMGQFIAHHLNLPIDEARQLQKAYFRKHGTTLAGMMAEHGTDPLAYLNYVHDIDISHLARAEALDAALTALPGRKLIFTNASEMHAGNVTRQLGIDHHFEGVFDIIAADYVPKPAAAPYHGLLAAYDIDPLRAAFFEDMAKNLAPAAALGMTTIWVRNMPDWGDPRDVEPDGDHVHHITDDLAVWLRGLRSAA